MAKIWELAMTDDERYLFKWFRSYRIDGATARVEPSLLGSRVVLIVKTSRGRTVRGWTKDWEAAHRVADRINDLAKAYTLAAVPEPARRRR